MTFTIIINDDRGEYSVYEIVDESRASDAIEKQKNGRKITFKTCDVTDIDAATREAERIKPNYHDVNDALAE
jgi:hypothetical protein